LAETAERVLAASEFVLDALVRDRELMPALLARVDQRLAGAPLALPAALSGSGASEREFMAALRRWRRAEFTRIAWRDLAGWAELDETLSALSRAADIALRAGHDFALRALEARHGRPRSARGEPQRLIIVAMGKLGGEELNFSSDIDLVMLYGEAGETDGPRRLDNQQFFTRLAQALIQLLEQRTEDGFAFRVDLRLRPFGHSGPVVSSAAALEDYLQVHGRDWERYAWVKARAVTEAETYARLQRELIGPFVFRRYLDYGIFESLRDMKGRIEREVARRELADNIKLGDGGIREIEFITQSFQLIRGGQDRRLQSRSLRRALPLLCGAKLLPAKVVRELDTAYVFLRRLENRLQMRDDQQLHVLPLAEDERARLAASMGYAEWSALHAAIEMQRGVVARHFHSIVLGLDPEALADQPSASAAPPSALPPLEEAEAPQLARRLGELGFGDGSTAARLLLDFVRESERHLDASGARRLAALLPVLIGETGRIPDPLAALRRLLRVLEAIGARSAYLALLLHNAPARRRLVEISGYGEFLIDQIAAAPLLLDELLDASALEQPPERATLAFELEQRMAGVEQEDEERLVERLREFQRAAMFRLAVCDLLARMPLMQVSDRLTDLAELILERALALAWRQLTAQLGTPMCGDASAGQRRAVRVAVVGYGKLGGRELGYASDLDLVFLHDSSGVHQETEGARSIENQVFFVRFAQRLVHLLTLHSAAGRLYVVDMRLRPSGKGGMLITNIDAFADYQRYEAWTWEHQALLHARSVAGDEQLRARFEAIRAEVLEHHVRRGQLRADVRHMRVRMRRELSHARAGEFDLKQDAGGVADIEFLAQYWALLWARDYPPVAMYSDTIRQLESVGSAALVPHERIDLLSRVYRRYREYLHHRALDDGRAMAPDSEFREERSRVRSIWDDVMGSDDVG
jgi:glutamate-ammonia-ligase adenylyltransferase